MIIKTVKKNNNVIIGVDVHNNYVDVGDILRVDFEKKPRYFKVNEIEANNADSLFVIAENYGYYDKLIREKNFDIRKLIGLDIIIVKNKETLEQLRRESKYL